MADMHQLTQAVMDLLKVILSSIDKLRNKPLQKELAAVQGNCGVAFPFFPNLPPELRRRVWEYAARAPQTHVLGGLDRVSRSKVNSIANSCVEAREAVSALKLDYFIKLDFQFYGKQDWTGRVRNYANLDVDTIWIRKKLQEQSYILHMNVLWVCGKCNMHPRHPSYDKVAKNRAYRGCQKNCQSKSWHHNSGWPGTFPRLAISFLPWINPRSTTFHVGTAQLLINCNVRELLLVVGDTESFNWQRDVQFEAPTRDPLEAELVLSAVQQKVQRGIKVTWHDLEEEIEMAMLKLKKGFIPHLKMTEGMSQAEDARFEYEGQDIGTLELRQDIERWQVPKVKLVEVRTGGPRVADSTF